MSRSLKTFAVDHTVDQLSEIFLRIGQDTCQTQNGDQHFPSLLFIIHLSVTNELL